MIILWWLLFVIIGTAANFFFDSEDSIEKVQSDWLVSRNEAILVSIGCDVVTLSGIFWLMYLILFKVIL